METKLKARWKRFADEYLLDLNKIDAYFRAGYKAKTRESARNLADRLLRKVPIQRYINARKEEITAKLDVRTEEIVAEARRIAFSDIRKIAKVENGSVTILESKDWGDDAARTVESISEGKQGLKVKLHSKLDALRFLGEYKRMLGPKPGDDDKPESRNVVVNVHVIGTDRKYKIDVAAS